MPIDKIIQSRKTEKVLADKPWPISPNQKELKATIKDLLRLASSAPYHKKTNETHTTNAELTSSLPYRFYVLDSENCRNLWQYIEDQHIPAGKVSNMLAAADALLLATWLPEPFEDGPTSEETEAIPFEGNTRNMEHIAAAAAAIQNVLLGATARRIPNYWSSGGQLRNSHLRKYLNVPLTEIMLGAIFLFPKKEDQGKGSILTGKLHDQGKEIDTWFKWIQTPTSPNPRTL